MKKQSKAKRAIAQS